MIGGGAPLRRLARCAAVLPALVVAAVVLPAIADLARIASRSPFGRDQGIFHYAGWALLQGEVLYRDVRDVNGPLTALVHAALIAVGAGDEVLFRTVTLVIDAASFAIVGALLPGLAHPGVDRPPRPSWAARAAWAAAAVASLGAQYLTYDYWHSTQRETFCDWFMFPAVAATVAGLAWFAGETAARAAARARLALAAAGALGAIACAGKPTYLALLAACAASVVVAGGAALPRRARIGWFGGGVAAGGLVVLVALALVGDVPAFLRVSLVDVPAMYRFIWPQPLDWFFGRNPRSAELWLGAIGSVVLVAAIVLRRLPRRALVIALLPAACILALVAQRKGFSYHHHPLSAAVRLQVLLVAVWACEAASSARGRWIDRGLAAVATAGVIALGLGDAARSPHRFHRGVLSGPRGPERETPAYFAGFPERDFHPWDMRLSARWLREHTPDGARVQTYGMDPYLLYLADRRSATPYIYSYDLSVGAALAGGPDLKPGPAEADAILAMQREHEDDLLRRLGAAPPAAFVLVDGSPTMSVLDAEGDLRGWCPRTAAWLDAEYELAAHFGAFRIFTPRDG
jgi:hypothetical protein